MKKIITSLVLSVFLLGSVFAYYTPTAKDKAMIKKIWPIVTMMNKQQKNTLRERIPLIMKTVSQDTRIYYILASILKIVEEKPLEEENTAKKKTNKLTDLTVWDTFAGLTLKSQEMGQNLNGCTYYVGLNFAWTTTQTGKLAGFFDEMAGKNLFYFTASNPTEAKISYPSNDDTEKLWSASIDNDEILDEQTKQKLLNGKTIEVNLTVTAYHYQGCQQSEKRTGITVQDIEVLNTDEQEATAWTKFTAGGFEPSWSIVIEGNTLKYSSPELYNPETQQIEDISYSLDAVEQQEDTIIFRWDEVEAIFTKQDCINEWKGDTSPYTVSFRKLADNGYILHDGCGEKSE